MWKYYGLLFLVVGIALYYVYVKDPCRNQLRTEFSEQYPGYEILDSAAAEGSPERVRCRVSYRSPGSEQTQEQTWLYLYGKSGWQFARVLEAPEGEVPEP
jgi:hypothetical protein